MYGVTNRNTPRQKTRTVLRVVLTAMLVLGFVTAGATSAAATPDCDEDDDSTQSATTPVPEECGEDDDSPRSVSTPEGDYDRSTGENPSIDVADKVADATGPAGAVVEEAAEWVADNADGISKSESDGMSHPTARVGAYGGGSIEGITTEQNERIRG
ncbi:hypothetical protein GRX03_14240 [Halovenus sp. WSH3]|uniref:Uncharacterized protein n=1 Tax=Halovenus carboxidivorans TaxID=2692199 RepID=A0A6B0TCW6_9EURY|nr:hypothetical protein [Halovenus carboxidivorans]MXR52760.1 hypothetical protein [Halovenus carboxidivorans]